MQHKQHVQIIKLNTVIKKILNYVKLFKANLVKNKHKSGRKSLHTRKCLQIKSNRCKHTTFIEAA